MRFSIKWLLAATAYAAVVCASVAYAGKAWLAAVTIGFSASVVVCVIAALFDQGAHRRFALAYLATAVTLWGVIIVGGFHGVVPLARVVDGAVEGVASQVPNRESVMRKVLAEQHRVILPQGAYLEIQDMGNFPVDHLKCILVPVFSLEALAHRPMALGYGGPDREWFVPSAAAQGVPVRAGLRMVVRQHLLFLFSLLGGLLGLWFWKREEQASASASNKEA